MTVSNMLPVSSALHALPPDLHGRRVCHGPLLGSTPDAIALGQFVVVLIVRFGVFLIYFLISIHFSMLIGYVISEYLAFKVCYLVFIYYGSFLLNNVTV